MKERQWWSGLPIAILGLAIGLAMVIGFVALRQPPGHEGLAPALHAVRYIEARPVELDVRVRGYGVARPAETWTARASVPGRIVGRSPDLASGRLVEAGTELLRIDPSRYELAIAEARAERATLDAEREQLDGEADNVRRLLELEREALELAERERARIERLFAGGSVSAAQRDEQLRATVQQRRAVQSLENELALIPARGQRLDTRIEQVGTRLSQVREDLAETLFVAPYDLRVRDVLVERNDHVSAGQTLFHADSVAAAEVVAHLPIGIARRLLGTAPLRPIPDTPFGHLTGIDLSAIRAEVRLVGDETVRWPARVTGVADGVDPRSRTVRVVVEVAEPYATARPPEQPPLVRDMYVRVHLASRDPEPRLIVPAAAIHQGEIYLVGAGERLERRPVRVAFEQQDLAVIAGGLEPGDRIVIDDLVPAIGGMLLQARRDETVERKLQRSTLGEMP